MFGVRPPWALSAALGPWQVTSVPHLEVDAGPPPLGALGLPVRIDLVRPPDFTQDLASGGTIRWPVLPSVLP